MQPQRANPLYSPLGCGTAVLLVLILGAILIFRGGGPFSPGPLTAAATQTQPLGGFNNHAEFEQDCGQCHDPWRGITASRCEVCHENIAEQRNSKTGLHGRLADSGRCAACHTDHEGRDADIMTMELASFEHDRLTSFSLNRHHDDYDGTPIGCRECHSPATFSAGQIDCEGCHTNAEPVFMSDHTALFGRDCLACHDGWDRLSDFDHDQFFTLDGAHEATLCESCHVEKLFAGTPQMCVDCHEEPAVHLGLFGRDCVRCHATTAWSPAQLTQHTFPLDHGGEGKIDCQTCHTAAYTTYTCYNCHAHDPAEVRQEHVEEEIFEFDDCIECHPTGLEDEGGRDND